MSQGQPGPTKPPASQSIPTEAPKPFTTPEGYVAPKMSELWLYVRPHGDLSFAYSQTDWLQGC